MIIRPHTLMQIPPVTKFIRPCAAPLLSALVLFCGVMLFVFNCLVSVSP